MRLAHYGTTPLTGDQIGYFHHARSLNWNRPFYIEVEPMTVWLNLLSQQAGQALNLSPSLSVRLGTFSLGLGVVVWLFFLARVWTGDAGALLAGLFWALSPFVCVADVAGGRDTPYILFLVGFSYFCFAPWRRRWLAVLGIGTMAGLMCLTRISGLFIVIPVSALALLTVHGRRFWLPWLAVLALIALIASPYIVFLWQETGDILYNLNSRAWWHSAEDPAAQVVHSFWDMFFRELGPLKLLERALSGMYLSLFGPVTLDSFFSRQTLPFGLYLAPYLIYLLGIAVAIKRLCWQPFLVLALATGPVWPLIAVGTDPRLVLGALPFMAIFLGMGGNFVFTLIVNKVARFNL